MQSPEIPGSNSDCFQVSNLLSVWINLNTRTVECFLLLQPMLVTCPRWAGEPCVLALGVHVLLRASCGHCGREAREQQWPRTLWGGGKGGGLSTRLRRSECWKPSVPSTATTWLEQVLGLVVPCWRRPQWEPAQSFPGEPRSHRTSSAVPGITPPGLLPVVCQKTRPRLLWCLTQLCQWSKPQKPGKLLFPDLREADGGRNLLDPKAQWGEAWWVREAHKGLVHTALKCPKTVCSCSSGLSASESAAGACFSETCWTGVLLWRAAHHQLLSSQGPHHHLSSAQLPPATCSSFANKRIMQTCANARKSTTHKKIHVVNQLHKHSCQKMQWNICKAYCCRLPSLQLEVQKNV